jgi:GT2 family glycosyltransferase
MSIPVLTIPHLNRPDLLHRCIASIDYPVETLVLIQNGRDEDTRIADILALLQSVPVGHFTHIRGPNLGCAASWNYAMIAFPQAPWWMFVGNDIQFCEGTMKIMAEGAAEWHGALAALFANAGHSCFIQTRRGTENVGLYDWNIHPAYTEDCDWMWRRECAREVYLDVEGARVVHGEPGCPGSCTIGSDVKLRDQCHRTHGNNFEYYRRKWGGMPGQEQFKTPFDKGGPVNELVFDPETRASNVWTI